MEEHVRAYIGCAGSSDSVPHRDALVGCIASGSGSFLELVQLMQDDLTTDENVRRRAATFLLYEVVDRARAQLSANDLVHFSTFFSARLTDWPSVEPAALGCNVLLSLQGSPQGAPPCPLQKAQALEIIRVAAGSLHVQSLAQPERHACLTMWLSILQAWGLAAAQEGVDLAEATIAVVDGEKDPRCLLLAFQCVRALLDLYARPAAPRTHIDAATEELFDVVACYFPVAFTPPKDNPHGITRADLMAALHATLTAAPRFAPLCITLILDKLASTLQKAKEDSLQLLQLCFQTFPGPAFQPSTHQLWSALKAEMMAPMNAEGTEDAATARQLAGLAGAALAAGAAALKAPGELKEVVLADACLQELWGALEAQGALDWGSEREGRRRACAAAVAAAVAAADPQAAAALIARCISAASSAARDRPAPSPRLPPALHTLHLLLDSALAVAARGTGPPPATDALMQQASAAAELLLEAVPLSSGDASVSQDAKEAQAVACLAWLDLLSAAPAAAGPALSQQQLEAAAGQLAALALAPAAEEEVELGCAWGVKASVRARAMAALEALGARHAAVLQEQVLPRLVRQAASDPASSPALEALLQLARPPRGSPQAPGGSCWVAVQRLMRPHVLSTLRAECAGDAPGDAQLAATVATYLQRTAAAVAVPIPADKPPTSWDPSTSADLSRLVQEMLTAATGSAIGAPSAPPSSGPLEDGSDGSLGRAAAGGADGAEARVGLVAAAGQYAAAVLRGCTAEDQEEVVEQAAALLGRSSAGVDQLGAAALVALRPAALGSDGERWRMVLEALMECEGSWLRAPTAQQGGHRRASALAIASLLAKWPEAAGRQEATEKVVTWCAATAAAEPGAGRPPAEEGTAPMDIEEAAQGPSSPASLWHAHLTGWLARALASTAHPSAPALLSHLLASLSPPGPASPPSRPLLIWELASALRTLLSDRASVNTLPLSRTTHCPTRVLWCQRTLTTTLDTLSTILYPARAPSDRNPASASPSTVAAPQDSHTRLTGRGRSNILLAASCALASCPQATYRGLAPLVPDPLLESLVALAAEFERVAPAAYPSQASVSPSHPTHHHRPRPVPVPAATAALVSQPDREPMGNGESSSTGELRAALRQAASEMQQVLIGCLLVLGDFLMDAQLRKELEGRVEGLVGALVRLARLAGAPDVREAALGCLAAVMEIPYHHLHTHRQKVLQAVTAALDDNSRRVRQAAVQCRKVWATS